jgi:hypothetical protein
MTDQSGSLGNAAWQARSAFAMLGRSIQRAVQQTKKSFSLPLDFFSPTAVVTLQSLNRHSATSHEIRTIYTTLKPPVNRMAFVVCGRHSTAGDGIEDA